MTFGWDCFQQAPDVLRFFNSSMCINHNCCSLFLDNGSVGIEGPMPEMAPLELTVSKAGEKLKHILFDCTGGRVDQQLMVTEPNVRIENVDLCAQMISIDQVTKMASLSF